MQRHWLLMFLALAACKSTEQKLLDANRDKMVVAIDRLKALAPVVDQQQHPVETNWPVAGASLGQTAQLVWANKLTGGCNRMSTTYAADNSGSDYIHLMNLDSTEGWLEKPVCAIEGNENLMLGLTPRNIDTLVNMKFALVLKPTAKEVPHIDRAEAKASVDSYLETGEGKAVEHFAGGHIAGDALLYEVATGKLVGNFPFDATSSPRVEVGASNDELIHDLNRQLENELQAWLAK